MPVKLPAKIGLGALAVLAVLQAFRVEHTNPPVTADLQAPLAVKEVLRRACYDCHSNETRWPWYSYVAPTSWLLHYDVAAGRQALNFSDWAAFSPAEQSKQRGEIVESIGEGEMPPWYVPMHPSARLSDADRSTIEDWARTTGP